MYKSAIYALISGYILVSSSIANAGTVVCEEQFKWLNLIPVVMQEAVLMHASYETHIKFNAVNSKPNVNPTDQLWGYKILSIGHAILSTAPSQSTKVKSLMEGFSNTTASLIKGEMKFEIFKKNMQSLVEQGEVIHRSSYYQKKEFLALNKTKVSALSSCVIVTAMMNALPKDKAKVPQNQKADDGQLELSAAMAGQYFRDVKSAQDEIVLLNSEMREVAIVSAGGKLNFKLKEWADQEVKTGNKTNAEFSYIAALSVQQLSLLTQALNLHNATACHWKEFEMLFNMSKGNAGEPANCRQEAYTTELQARAISKALYPEVKSINELANKWATKVLLFSEHAARLDNYGRK